MQGTGTALQVINLIITVGMPRHGCDRLSPYQDVRSGPAAPLPRKSHRLAVSRLDVSVRRPGDGVERSGGRARLDTELPMLLLPNHPVTERKRLDMARTPQDADADACAALFSNQNVCHSCASWPDFLTAKRVIKRWYSLCFSLFSKTLDIAL